MAARPEAVLWAAYSTKNAGLQAKFKNFYTDWPQAKQKIPYVQMQEMRIVPELPIFEELVDKIFFELMDGKLATPEEMKAFLEPYSPPAPPPPVHLRRARATKKDAKPAKSRKKAAAEVPAEDAEGANGAAAQPVIAATGSKAAKALALPALPAKGAALAKQAAPAKAVEKGKLAPAKIERFPREECSDQGSRGQGCEGICAGQQACRNKTCCKGPCKEASGKEECGEDSCEEGCSEEAACKDRGEEEQQTWRSKPVAKKSAGRAVAKGAKKPAAKGAAKKKR